MRKKKKSKAWILILVIILVVAALVINLNREDEETEVTITETEVIKTDILNTVSKSSYIQTALQENKELHATYYFKEIYFEENQYIKEGENILKYTNGTYMEAPYDCVITSMSIPESGNMCTNNHYLTLQSTETFKISLSIDEDELDTVYVGQEALIEVETLENSDITGYVTNISNTATYSSSGSKFQIEVEFQNNGEILLGMSVKCSIVLEKAEDVIAVANEAITSENRVSYVTIKLEDGTTKQVEIETGISNDAYTEIKSGLSEGDIALIEESTEESRQNNSRQMMDMGGSRSDRREQNGEEMPNMPSGGTSMGGLQK